MTQDADKPLVFVLIPFAQEFDRIFERLIRPSLEGEGYKVERADTDLSQRNIMRTIVEGIAKADLIVAELTGNNPNVFYELGIAHGLQKPVIMISQALDQVPFDLRSYNVVTYSTEFDAVDAFTSSLRSIGQGCIRGTVDFENPVSDFALTERVAKNVLHGSPQTPISTGEVATEGEVGEASSEERGVLDFTSGVEFSMEQIGEIAGKLTGFMNDFGVQMAARNAEVEAINRAGATGGTAQMLRLARSMATDMTRFSDNVDAELPTFHKAWEDFERDFTNVLSTVTIESEEDRGAALTLVSQLGELRVGLRQALDGLDAIRGEFQPLVGISAPLSAAVRRLEGSLGRIYEEFSTGESVLIRTVSLLDQKLQST